MDCRERLEVHHKDTDPSEHLPLGGKTRISNCQCFSMLLLISFRADAQRGSTPPQFLRWEPWLLLPPTPCEWAEHKYLPLLLTETCDVSSHSLSRLPVCWWQLPTHLFTIGSHFRLLVPANVKGTFCSGGRMTSSDYRYPVRRTVKQQRQKRACIIHSSQSKPIRRRKKKQSC